MELQKRVCDNLFRVVRSTKIYDTILQIGDLENQLLDKDSVIKKLCEANSTPSIDVLNIAKVLDVVLE